MEKEISGKLILIPKKLLHDAAYTTLCNQGASIKIIQAKHILIVDSCMQNDNAQVDDVQTSSNSSNTLLPQ